MAENAVGVTYYGLYHFLTQAPWDAQQVNQRRESGDESVFSNED